MFGVADRGADLRELFNSVPDLLIKNATICNDDNRVKYCLVVFR